MASHLEEGEYKDGKKHGYWVVYYADGGKRREGAYDMGQKEGRWIEYHRNGNRASVNNYHRGKPVGRHVAYHENGKKKQTGQFNELGKGALGRKTGPWTFCDTDGETVWRVITYKNGCRTKKDEHPLGTCPVCDKPVQSPSWEKCPDCDAELIEYLG